MKSALTLKRIVWLAFKYLYIACQIFVMLFPLFFMFMSAFKTSREIDVTPFALPTSFDAIVANVTNVINGQLGSIKLTPFFTMLANTLILTIVPLIFMLILATLCAYGLGRYRFRGKGIVMGFILLVQTVPFFGYITPMQMLIDGIHLYDSHLGVIPVYVAVALPATIVLMQGFFRTFPVGVEEAALIDGCSEVKKFLLVVAPMSIGIIGSMAIVNFMAYWNEFAIASLLLSDAAKKTINLGIFALKTQLGGVGRKDYIMTLLTLAALPNLLFFTVLQKSIINGISLGSLKG